jgi:hypothetical protein
MLRDGEIRNQTVIEGGSGQHDMVLLERYVGPNPESISEAEKFQAVYDFDIWRANRVKSVLLMIYPGHLWAVEHDLAQGVCKIKLPLLMPITAWYVLNLGTHGDLTKGMIIASGGELLERYRQRRGRFNLAEFLDARAKYSALVDRRRQVPT